MYAARSPISVNLFKNALEASRDTETGQEASRAAPVPGPTVERGARVTMEDQGARAAMADPGARAAMADQGVRVAMTKQGIQEAMAAMTKQGIQEACLSGWSPTTPPPKKYHGALWRHGHLGVLWKRGHCIALSRGRHCRALWRHGHS